MILVVALNPALDVTHQLGHVDWAGVNRPAAVHARPGGKGVNVARVLHALGDEVLLTGLAGGLTGNEVSAALRAGGVPADFAGITGQTRRTFAVVDTGRGETAIFNEPGPAVTAAEYAAFREQFAAALPRASAVVLSGSLPPGVPAETYAELIAVATGSGVPSLLDASGAALRVGVKAGPAVVKPNLAELEELSDRSLRAGDGGPDLAAIAVVAAELRTDGITAVVVTLGAAGLLAVTGAGAWHAAAPAVRGNPTGAGDAVAAALARGLVTGGPWPARLGHAAALGAAAAASPVAGDVDREEYVRAADAVLVRPVAEVPCR